MNSINPPLNPVRRLLVLFLYIASSVLLFSCVESESKSKSSNQVLKPVLNQKEMIARGGYLVEVGGCNDCHSPKIFTAQGPVPDTSRLMSGHPSEVKLPVVDLRALQPGYWVLFNDHTTAAVGPWGLTYAKNLTPHETGIKGWQEEFFIKALRTGKHMGAERGRPIMPPMPWPNLAQATDDDLKSIFAYLQSLKPIDNYVPEPVSPEELTKMVAESQAMNLTN
jgi:hypothetical protein